MFWRVGIILLILALSFGEVLGIGQINIMNFFSAVLLLLIAHELKRFIKNIAVQKNNEKQIKINRVIGVISLLIAIICFFGNTNTDDLIEKITASIIIFVGATFVLSFIYPFFFDREEKEEFELKETIIQKEIYKELVKLNTSIEYLIEQQKAEKIDNTEDAGNVAETEK
jgi:SNF family Na+-dependent transporter